MHFSKFLIISKLQVNVDNFKCGLSNLFFNFQDGQYDNSSNIEQYYDYFADHIISNHELGYLIEKPKVQEKRWRGVNFNIDLLKRINSTLVNINDSQKRIFNRIFDVKPSINSFKKKLDEFLKDYELTYLPSPKLEDKYDLYEPDYTFYLNNKGYNSFFVDYVMRNDSDIGKRENFIRQYNKIIKNEIDDPDTGFFLNSVFKEFYIRLQAIYDFTVVSENTSIKISENFDKIKSSLKQVIDEFEYLKLFLHNENYKYITTVDTIYDYIKVYAYKVLLGFYYVTLLILIINIILLYIFVNQKLLWIRFIHYFICMLFFALAIVSLTVGALFKIMGVAFYDSVGVGQFLFSEQNLLIDKVFVDTTENAHILKSCIHDRGDLANIVFSLNVNCLYLENFYKDSFILDRLTTNLINGGNYDKIKNNSAFSEIYFETMNRRQSSNSIQANQNNSSINNSTVDNSIKYFNKTISSGLVNSTKFYFSELPKDNKKSIQVENYLALLDISKKNYSYLGESDISTAFKESLKNLEMLTDGSLSNSYQKNCQRQTQDKWIFNKNYCQENYNYIDKSIKNTVYSKQCFTINQWSLLEVRNKYRFSPSECKTDSNNQDILDKYITYNQAISKSFDKIKKTIDKNDLLIDDISMVMDSINEEFKEIYDYLITNVKALKPLYSDIQKLMFPFVRNSSLFSFMNCSFVKNDLNYLLWEMEEETSYIFTDVGAYFIATALCLVILLFFMIIVVFRYTVFPPRINFFIDEDEYEEMKLIEDKKEYGNTRIDKEDVFRSVKVKNETNGAEIEEKVEKVDEKIKKILNNKTIPINEYNNNKEIIVEETPKTEINESNVTEIKVSEINDECELKILPNQDFEKNLIKHKKNKSTHIPSLRILPNTHNFIKEKESEYNEESIVEVESSRKKDDYSDSINKNDESLIEEFSHKDDDLIINKHKKNHETKINVRNINKFKSEGSKNSKMKYITDETIVTESVNNKDDSIYEGVNPNFIINSSKKTNAPTPKEKSKRNEQNNFNTEYENDKTKKEIFDQNKSVKSRKYSDSIISEKYNDTVESVENNIGKKLTNIVTVDYPKNQKKNEKIINNREISEIYVDNTNDNVVETKNEFITENDKVIEENVNENKYNNYNNPNFSNIKNTEQDSKIEETNSDLKSSYQEYLKPSKVNLKKTEKDVVKNNIDAPKLLLVEGEKTLNYNPKKKIIPNTKVLNDKKDNTDNDIKPKKVFILEKNNDDNDDFKNVINKNLKKDQNTKKPNINLDNAMKDTKNNNQNDDANEEDEYEEYEEEIEYESEELVEE